MTRQNFTLILFTLIVACFFRTGSLQAQNKVQPIEKVHVLLNKNVAVTGEFIEYSTTLEADGTGLNSTMVYYQLIDFNNKVIHRWRQPLKNGFNSGQMAIPEKLASGIYILKAFTHSIANLPVGYQEIKPLVILQFNDKVPGYLRFSSTVFSSENLHRYFSADGDSLLAYIPSGCGLLATIKLTDSILSKNKPLAISVQTGSDTLYFSLSIKKQTPFDALFYDRQLLQAPQTDSELKAETFLNYKERNFILVEGTVTDSITGKPLQNFGITATWSNHSANFKQAVTDSAGQFRFLFDSLWDNRLIYFQLNDAKLNGKAVQWKINSTENKWEETKADSVELNFRQKEYLKQLQKASLVERIYFEQQISRARQNSDSMQSFYGIPDRTIYPNEYLALNNFVEICSNIIPGVTLAKNHKGYSFSMVLRDNQPVARENILVLLNGVPFDNYSYIALLSSAAIQRIDIFNSAFIYGRMKFNGAIAIYTVDNTLKPEWFSNPVYIFDNQTGIETISVKSRYQVSLPPISQDFYWLTGIDASNNTPVKVNQLPPSGKYMIELLGVTRKGEYRGCNKIIAVP